ncbi:hypothetical protein M513_01370 [Trichuris suis]|uniref:Uncharacterized protein n=1 Tax=Trichuris suis TaxID=68888 RepID=A0A085MKF4_9BILA|nr:hypothetical protein M513_01370 [Trichuris suis]
MSVALPSQAKLGSVATSTWRARLLVTAEGPRQNRFTLRETDGVPWKLYALCVSFPASLFVKNAFLCKKHASWLSKCLPSPVVRSTKLLCCFRPADLTAVVTSVFSRCGRADFAVVKQQPPGCLPDRGHIAAAVDRLSSWSSSFQPMNESIASLQLDAFCVKN